MNSGQFIEEAALAAIAKQYREAAGKSRAEAARELGISRPTVFQAEQDPKASLFKVRKRIIERYSTHILHGPVYWLEPKS